MRLEQGEKKVVPSNLLQLACVLGQFLNNFCMLNEQKCKWNYCFPTHAGMCLPGYLP